MVKFNKILSQFIKKYSDFKEKRIFKIENKGASLSLKIKKEKIKFEEALKIKEKLKAEDEEYEKMYKSLVRILESRGIILNVHNRNYKIREWDNLSIKKINGLYGLVNKSRENEIIYLFQKRYIGTIEHIVRNYRCSIIVTRMDKQYIKMQLRITGQLDRT